MRSAMVAGRNSVPQWVGWLACVALAIASALAASVVLSAVVLVLAGDARADEGGPRMRASEVQQGTLLFRARGEREGVAAPLLSTDVDIRVSGIVARASVRQVFHNPGSEWLEGIYVFPLPENAAVDRLRMQVGSRTIEGEIRERAKAKAEFEQAKREGKRATLVEQERPNMFTTSVANIGPGEDVVVEIEYQQTLRFDAGRMNLRFPMVVGPRYIPGNSALETRAGSGWAPDTDAVPDASRITPPVLDPTRAAPTNPVRILVELDAGAPLVEVTSPYHRIDVRKPDERRHLVKLAEGQVPANRDFELTWSFVSGTAPRSALYTEEKDGRTYALFMLMPPAVQAGAARLPRETIFVVDTSGSMEGTSIVQAKEALQLALARLAPEDRFNVIEFNSTAQALFREARPVSGDALAQARRFVGNLVARGGTEMAGALNLALNGGEDPQRVRQIVFLTDGAVGNEEQLFALIERRLGDSRLFTVGIGAAPNGHFMAKAAQAGRGSYTYIGKVEEVRAKMSELFDKLESPVLKDVSIDWPVEGVEQYPARLPDLYAGEPIVVSAMLPAAGGTLRVKGTSGTTGWQDELRFAQAQAGEGMGVRWAREKIDVLTDGLRDGVPEDEVRKQVVEVALAHHLVSKYTSLVAVDRTPARPADAALRSGAVPTNLPEGWNHAAVFGELPQGATDSRLHLVLGLSALLAAAWLGRRRTQAVL